MSNIRIKYDFHTLDRMYNALRQFNDKKILALDPYVNGIIFYDFTILYFEDFHYATHLGYDFSKTFPDGRKFKIELNKVSKGMYEIKIAKDMIYEYRLLDSDDFSTIETEKMRKDEAIKFIQDSEKKYGKLSNHQKLILMANINKLR